MSVTVSDDDDFVTLNIPDRRGQAYCLQWRSPYALKPERINVESDVLSFVEAFSDSWPAPIEGIVGNLRCRGFDVVAAKFAIDAVRATVEKNGVTFDLKVIEGLEKTRTELLPVSS